MKKLDQREWCAWSPRADGTEKPDSFKWLMRMRPARAPARKVEETAT